METARHVEIRQLIEQQITGWTGDIEKLLVTFTDTFRHEDAGAGVVSHEREELRKFAKRLQESFPDGAYTITSFMLDGDRASIEWTFVGTQTGKLRGLPASNRRMSVHGASMFELDGSKIRRQTDYWDLSTMLRQLGHMP